MNVLSLYQKAQSTVLDARELAWVENEAREHPYFGLPYMISARHHLSQKTTVKDRALLMGAAYCMDRTMLHGYVQDLLQQPRAAKHVSVVATASDSIVESVATPVVEEVVAVAESVAAPIVEEAPIVAETIATPVVEAAPIVAETIATPVVEEAPIVAETVATPVVEEAPIVAETVATPVVEAAPVVAPTQAPDSAPQYTPRGINWFLNMRLKLRTQKFASLPNRIRTAAAAHDASQRDLPAASIEATSVAVPQTAPDLLPETPQVAPNTTLQAEGGKTKEDGYSIGAFSSFSFVETDDDSPEGLEENLVMSREAISLHTPTQPEENGEIVLEEENRTVEIIVSPELLAKFFNGHLPAAHPAPAAEEQPERMHLEFLPQDAPQVPPTPVRPLVVPVKRATPSAQDLIDRFIEQEPSIKRQGGVDIAPGDLARESNVERDEWVTETLARIYAKQGNKNKAIKIYQKLGLLFPEKRDYFAARIAELK